jgi:hypothetical protein
MATNAVYKVSSVAQVVYLDPKGKAVNGYALTVDLIEFGETHTVNVPSNDPLIAKAAIQALVHNRRALAELSE